MNKKLKIFIKVVYYITTFSLGLFLALYLPRVLYYNETMSEITKALTEENYPKSMIYIGGYFNDEYVYSQRFDENSGIVIFESVTLVNNPNKTDQTNRSLLQDSYSGFIYNISKKYNVAKTKDNKTMLVITDKEGKETNISLLDRDKDSDGYMDSSNTLEDSGFIFLDISKLKVASVAKIKFIDCDGNEYKNFDLSDKNLNFESDFFTAAHKFTDVFNQNNGDSKLVELDKELKAKSSHYIYSNYSSGNVNVTTKAVFIILGYFLGIYLIADSILGKRYVYRGIKYVVCKIFKIQPKPKKEKNSTYSSDYFTMVTLSLDISNLTEEEKEEFPDEVEIKYNNENEIINLKVQKEEGYKLTERIRAGVYTNFMTSLPKDQYYFSGLTNQLKISGFKTNVLIIVRKKR